MRAEISNAMTMSDAMPMAEVMSQRAEWLPSGEPRIGVRPQDGAQQSLAEGAVFGALLAPALPPGSSRSAT